MKKILRVWIKKILSDSHSAIVGLLLGAIVLSGGWAIFYGNLWTYIKTTMQLPTPLWATTASILLLGGYFHLKTSRDQKRDQKPSQEPHHRIEYFTVGKYKWQVKIYKSNYLEIDEYPFCVKHDLRFIFSYDYKYCPGPEKQGCPNRISKGEFFRVYESAKSIIDNKVRNG